VPPVATRLNPPDSLIKLFNSKQVAACEAALTGLRSCNELSKPVNHSVAPFRSFYLAADRRTYLPVEVNQRSVDGLNGGALIHKGRGQSSNHRLTPGVREYALELVRTRYADFGPTLAIEVLLDKHGLKVGRETLRTWMVEDGLWLSRKQRRSFHQPRLRRESYGELVQFDGSDHRWFEQRGEPCTLLVFIDDATSKLMQLRFVPSESTDSYFGALQGYLNDHGCPVAFYSDKHTVFRVNKPDAGGGSGMTQFGRALAELNIEIIYANSSQAKGSRGAGKPHPARSPGQEATP